MLKIHSRNDLSVFRQMIGILLYGIHISDEESGQVFITDLGRDNTRSRDDVIIGPELAHAQFSLFEKGQVSGNDAGISCGQEHRADIGGVIRHSAHFCPGPACFGDNAGQTFLTQYIHIYGNAAGSPSVDGEGVVPASGLFCDDLRRDSLVIKVLLIQRVQLLQLFQPVLGFCQAEVLRLKSLDLLFQAFILGGELICRPTLCLPFAEQVSGSAYAVLQRNDQPAHALSHGAYIYKFKGSKQYESKADNGQDDQQMLHTGLCIFLFHIFCSCLRSFTGSSHTWKALSVHLRGRGAKAQCCSSSCMMISRSPVTVHRSASFET